MGAENRATLCDLGVLVVEAAEPVAAQNAPCRAVADTRVHPRYTAGISEGQRPGPCRRFRATGFPGRSWRRLRIVSIAPCQFRTRLSAQPQTFVKCGGDRLPPLV